MFSASKLYNFKEVLMLFTKLFFKFVKCYFVYILIGILFFASLLACTLAINLKHTKEKAEVEYVESETARKKQREDFTQFLTETKLWNKYKRWANK